MKTSVILILVTSITLTTTAAANDKAILKHPTQEDKKKMCAQGPTTQLENNICAGLEFEKWDNELNRVYQQILKMHENDKAFLQKLRAAQKAWIFFRDAELEAIYPLPAKSAEYGSSYGMCYSTWKTILTKERIRQLKKWIDGFAEDIPKEDVCGGSLLPQSNK